MKKYIFTFLCGMFCVATLLVADEPPKAPVIVGLEHALSERMLSPQPANKRTLSSFFQRDKSVATEVETVDLGDGISLVSDVRDLTGSLLEINVTAEQWSELISDVYFIPRLKDITNRVYSKVNDDFDFIFFVLNTPVDDVIKEQLGFYGLTSRVSNNVQGLGIGKHDFTDQWGSQGKLISALFFPYYDALSAGPALHEILHSYGTFICPTYDLGKSQYLAHWGISNADGQAGGFKYLRVVEENVDGVEGKTLYQASRRPETNRDGSFKYGGFGINANDGNGTTYSDIELYLMGLKSDDELRSANFQLDVYSGNEYQADSFAEGYFSSTAKKSYTIDDIIARNGKRVPDYSASQKQFKVLTVVLTPEMAEQNYMNEIMRDINWLAGEIDDATYPHLYNFRQATQNRGSILVNSLTGSLKTPVIRTTDAPTVEEETPVIEDIIIAESFEIAAQGEEEEGEEEDAYVYPNPTTDGMFTLEYEAQSEIYIITLTDARGNLLMRRTASEPIVHFNLGGFPSGVYMLTIEDGLTQITKRVVKN